MPDIESPVTRREVLKKGLIGAAGLTVLPAVVAACSSSSPTPTQAPPPTSSNATPGPTIVPAPTTPNYAGRTLTIWDYESADSAMGQSWAAAIDTFKSTHPGVTVTHEAKTFEEIQSNASMILNSNAAPDVMEYNKGNATAGLLSTQGLLTDLTSVATARGWDKILTPSLQTTCIYSDKGIMGSGKWYGVTTYGEYVMVYYNQDMFTKYNIMIPKTLADFETAMDTFVKAGITPVATGGAEYPAQQIFYQLVLSQANRQWINDYEMYANPVDFHDTQLTFGANEFVKWMKNGYMSKNEVALTAQQAGDNFEGGKNPIFPTGSWWYGSFITEITKFKWGIFLFPGNTLAPGSSGNIWVIPSVSKNADLAEDFIDITLQTDIQNIMGRAGGLPVNADPTAITDPTLQSFNQTFQTLLKNDGLAFYPDWPVPGYYNVLVSNVQNLMNGQDPSKFLDAIGQAYNAGKPSM
ncbi:MAG: extracellular solute-binding protein [Candidatus Limnocylindrales bacterium]|jgi:raffinose/stachyose/melibiose transport system substrate-binding protein